MHKLLLVCLVASACRSNPPPAPALPRTAAAPAGDTARLGAPSNTAGAADAVDDDTTARTPHGNHCPSGVDGADTRVVDGANDVEVVVTAHAAAAVAAIRAAVSDEALERCRDAMEPSGWMDDDCFNDRDRDGPLRCPIMARTAAAEVVAVDGGVKLVMHADGWSPEGEVVSLAQLRAEIHRRAARYRAIGEPAPPQLPSSGPFAFPDDWRTCKVDRDCVIVDRGCCDAAAVDRTHRVAADGALADANRGPCPNLATCTRPRAHCAASRCSVP